MTSRRHGFALIAALVAIILIAVLVTGALFASSQESQAASTQIADHQAFAYAERAALLEIAHWSCPECDLMPVGSVIIRNPAPRSPFESTVFVSRLDSALFLVTGEGRVMSSGVPRAHRSVSIAVTISRDSTGSTTAASAGGEAWSAVRQM
jgi:type II secretory pathway pseudopilin PulG